MLIRVPWWVMAIFFGAFTVGCLFVVVKSLVTWNFTHIGGIVFIGLICGATEYVIVQRQRARRQRKSLKSFWLRVR